MNQVSPQLSSEFEGMSAVQIGNLIDKVIDLIWTHNFRKVVKGSQFRKAGDSNIRNAVEQRIGNPGVDRVLRRDVIGQNLQSVMGEAAAQLIGPSGARCPGPVCG